MNRRKALSYIEYIFSNELDTTLFYVGKYLASESSYLPAVKILSDIDFFSIAFGISMALDKKLIIVCEDVFLLKYLSSVVQLGVGKRKNILILCLVTGVYTNDCKQPTIFDSANSLKGIFLNAGFLVHNYNQYFKNKIELKNITKRLKTIDGPLVGLVTVTDSKLFNIGNVEDNFIGFINTEC